MTHKLLLLGVILFAGFGCGILDQAKRAAGGGEGANVAANVNSNKTLTDKAVDTALGEQKIGIVECDEALDILSEQANNPEDNFVTKAVKKTALNTFRDQLKKRLEARGADKTEVAKFCREFRDNLGESLNENSNANKGGSF